MLQFRVEKRGVARAKAHAAVWLGWRLLVAYSVLVKRLKVAGRAGSKVLLGVLNSVKRLKVAGRVRYKVLLEISLFGRATKSREPGVVLLEI